MKKLLFSFIILAGSLLTNAQQMKITITGSTVKFTTRVDSSTGTDWTSAPVYLYAYSEVADNSAGVFKELLGSFGGTILVDDGMGNFSTTVNLSSFYPSGTVVNNIKFIYTAPNGSGGFFQNPGSGGFSTTDASHTSGWSAVTVASLGVNDLSNAKKNSFVANGKLYTKQTGNLDVKVYDMTGKIVAQSQVKSSDAALDLNVKQTGTYIVKVSNGSQTETVKFIK
ncbi:T9SS type A sorting domain-containing protein [Halpernia frigidisoli]|uniref:Por secretion system C-terminal sorting domain-containing protein n=1 Tax=Halpernia frigidisoli TaxID=1125876 RepID=A0A1I3I4N4_9FLAO|nr:T9SS type A sorting domain-containing protein [Halpernia frigidisoli]SFI42944.1 Por secretion system C-terminal sorting domain-containing protein [Halpernia frigidisoli]